MDSFEINFEPGWDKYFAKLDHPVQERILKKIMQLQSGIQSRHLKHGLSFFVEEIGGYRIAFKSDDTAKKRKVYFAGSHKDYEKWYKSQ
ncbi:hypothetical protein AUJ14_05210 [Candidatus Micrarchaeota archaeon CG1_02_55_22]|nr:MAG: hypothetical protein AUJ14_05210 [Candidatus Micrarchaeota archaeon CG1_02_55_22]